MRIFRNGSYPLAPSYCIAMKFVWYDCCNAMIDSGTSELGKYVPDNQLGRRKKPQYFFQLRSQKKIAPSFAVNTKHALFEPNSRCFTQKTQASAMAPLCVLRPYQANTLFHDFLGDSRTPYFNVNGALILTACSIHFRYAFDINRVNVAHAKHRNKNCFCLK